MVYQASSFEFIQKSARLFEIVANICTLKLCVLRFGAVEGEKKQ
jgi:hypothetical protein